jgi:hypothetical protein
MVSHGHPFIDIAEKSCEKLTIGKQKKIMPAGLMREERVVVKNLRLSVFLLLLLVPGCTTISDRLTMNKFSEASRAYGEAILWSHFEAANLYRKSGGDADKPPDFEKLKTIKVAMYDVKQIDLAEDKRHVNQVVEIKYYKLDNMIIKTVRDEQLWEYDPKENSWYLSSDLPQFK